MKLKKKNENDGKNDSIHNERLEEEEEDLSLTGIMLFLSTILFLVTMLYAILFSKWLPSTGYYVLDLIKNGKTHSNSFNWKK